MTRAEILAQVQARMAGGGAEQPRTKAQILEGVKARMAPAPEPMTAPLKNVSDKEGPARPEWTESQVNEDTMKSVFSWPARAATAALGMVGDIDQLGRSLDQRFGFTGESPETPLPTQDSLMQRARGMVPAEVADTMLHEAQSPVGKIVQGTLDVVGPGLASQTARVSKAGLKALDPGMKLADKVRRQYDILNQAGVGYDPANWNALASRLNAFVGNSDVSPRVRGLIDEMTSGKMVQRLGGTPIYADEIEGTYQKAGRLFGRGSDNDKRVMAEVRRELDDFRENSPVISGNMSGPEAVARLKQARYDASRNIKDKRLAAVERRAAAVAPDQASAETKNRINSLLRNEGFTGTLSPEEMAAMQKIASRGGMVEDFLTSGGPLGHVIRGATLGVASNQTGGDWQDTLMAAGIGAFAGKGAAKFGAARRANALAEARRVARIGPRRMNAARAANELPPAARALGAGTGVHLLNPPGSAPVALLPDGTLVPLGDMIPQDDTDQYYGPAGIRG